MSDNKHKTVLGTDCRLNGELALDSDAVIMGQFKGTLRVNGALEISESARVAGGIVAGAVKLAGTVEAEMLRVNGVLEITNTAKVSGTIIAGMVRVAGIAEADVVAEHGIELLPGAQLTGQIYTTTLQIAEGAAFQGEVCVGPKAIQAAGAILRQAQESGEGPDMMEEEPAPAMEPAPMQQPQVQQPADQSNIRIGSSSLNSMLQRRRAKVLAGAGAKPLSGNGHAGNGHTGNGSL